MVGTNYKAPEKKRHFDIFISSTNHKTRHRLSRQIGRVHKRCGVDWYRRSARNELVRIRSCPRLTTFRRHGRTYETRQHDPVVQRERGVMFSQILVSREGAFLYVGRAAAAGGRRWAERLDTVGVLWEGSCVLADICIGLRRRDNSHSTSYFLMKRAK